MSKEKTPIEQMKNAIKSAWSIGSVSSDDYEFLMERCNELKKEEEKQINTKVSEALELYQNLISKLIKEISDADYHESQEHFLKVIIEELKSIKAKQK